MKNRKGKKNANPNPASAPVVTDATESAPVAAPTEIPVIAHTLEGDPIRDPADLPGSRTGALTFDEALEAAGQPEAAPLKEEKEKTVRKVAPEKTEESKPVNRIEREGADFRLFIMGEKRGSYAFYATAAHAFEAEVGRPPAKGEYPNGDSKPETPPAVINESRIIVSMGKGFDVFFNGKFAGWKPTRDEAEEFLTRVKTREAAKANGETPAPTETMADALKINGHAPAGSAIVLPTEVPAKSEKSPKTAKKASKKDKKAADPGAVSPELAAHCAETVRQAGIEAETGRIRESLITLKALSSGYGPDAIAKFLADLPEEFIRAEAERRGLLKPASSPANGNGTKRSHPGPSEGHRELTKKAWEIARKLAAEKGGKPQDHMKEAWSGLVRD